LTAFADSSALVKLYAEEEGSKDVADLGAPLAVSLLARVEVPAAIWRKRRMGELSDSDAGILVDAFEADWFGSPGREPRFLVVGTVPEVLEEAARLVAVHGLRAYDGVQLASALATHRADPACDTLAAFDGVLRSAAVTESLRLVPRST
jgi:predicted nucleic acid-binding protein